MKLNLPNKITIFRIILAFPLTIFLFLSHYYNNQDLTNQLDYSKISMNNYSIIFFIISLLIFALAMFSDFLDGYIARKNNQITDFGKLFDPLSDKIITNIVLLFFVISNLSFWYIFLIFLIRDLIVDGFRNVAAKNNIKIEASIFGKIKTVLQTIGIILIFILCPIFINYSNWDSEIIYYLNIPLFLAVIFSLISGFLYIKEIFPYIKN
ncbi:MAG: CDP-diacylglycerol--glycerol-3-phosphate 3-phosphatidyltransferase [Metamycoplasmataceae bacterium]